MVEPSIGEGGTELDESMCWLSAADTMWCPRLLLVGSGGGRVDNLVVASAATALRSWAEAVSDRGGGSRWLEDGL